MPKGLTHRELHHRRMPEARRARLRCSRRGWRARFRCTRRARSARLLALGSCAALALSTGGCGGSSAPAAPRNVVLVLFDTLRPDRLGAHGCARGLSPRLDELAKQCVVFENAQSTAPWTAPSVTSILTSLYPDAHGVLAYPNPGRLSERATTLAEILDARGYHTAAFTEGGFVKAQFGLGQGFDHFDSIDADDPTNSAHIHLPSRLEENLDKALAWLAEHRDGPFFLFFHTYEVHQPFRADEAHVRALRPGYDEAAEHGALARAAERWNEERVLEGEDAARLFDHAFHCNPLDALDFEDLPGLRERLSSQYGQGGGLPERTVAFARDLYDAEVMRLDEQMERLWRALDELFLADETLLVVTSDHGEGLGEHGAIGHSRLLFDEILSAVLWFRVPDARIRPGRIAELARTVDVVPTVLDLLGIRAEAQFQGSSLAPLMQGQGFELPSFSHAVGIRGREVDWHSVRTGRWRYIEEAPDGSAARGRLFDLAADPGETVDVAAEHPGVVERLRVLLAQQRESDRRFHRACSGEAGAVELDERALEELSRLGYLGSARDP